jgi:hypothetical protein
MRRDFSRRAGNAWLAVCLALASLNFTASPLCAAPAELTRVRVLLAFDSASNLAGQLVIDEARLVRVLRASIPAGRLDLTVLKGRDLTRANVLGYYQRLRTGPREAIVFFYGGHGTLVPHRGHVLSLQEGKDPLLREQVRRAMLSKRAGLTVLLTDCCSAYPKRRGVAERAALDEARGPSAPLQHLFLRARGLVDVTAASPGGSSYGDSRRGGLFTFAFCQLAARPLHDLDSNRDGRVSWKEFFPPLQRATEGAFRDWYREMRDRPGAETITDTHQRPQAFALEAPRPYTGKRPPALRPSRAAARGLEGEEDALPDVTARPSPSPGPSRR